MLWPYRARERELGRCTPYTHAIGTQAIATQHLTRQSPADGLPPGAGAAPNIAASSPVKRYAALFDQLEHQAPSRASARKALRARGGELGDEGRGEGRAADGHLIPTRTSSLGRGTLAGREALTPKNSAHDHHLVRIELPVHLPGTGVGRCIMLIKKELAHPSGQFFPVRQQRQHCAAQSWLHRRCSN